MNTPQSNPDHPSDAVTSIRSSILYLLGVTAFGGVFAGGFLLFLMLPDTDSPPPLITDIIPYTIGDIFNDSINIFVIFAFLMLFIIMPLQLPGWRSIWKTCRIVQATPGGTPSLIGLRRVAWAAAVAYLWAVIGVGVSILGFDIYLAMLNPDFTWINPGKAGISDILLIIGQALWIMAAVICIQFPGWLVLWLLNRSTSPMPDDPRWQRWRKGAVIYLKWSAIATVVAAVCVFGYWGFERYQALMASGYELDIGFGLYILFARTIIAVIYVLPIVLLVQLPGWLVMAWLEQQRRQRTKIPQTRINSLRLLQATAIGYLAMIIAAIPTWWLRLEYIDNYDRDMLIPYLTPVLDGLLWAQIPGWAALCLWLALWLNQRQRTL